MTAITPAQIRGARGLVDWSLMDLARAAGVSVSTAMRVEQKRVEQGSTANVSTAMIGQIRGTFEAAGVEFVGDEGDRPGIRLSLPQAQAIFRFMR